MARRGVYEAYVHSNWAHSAPACSCCGFKQSRRGTRLYVLPSPMEVLTHDYDYQCETDDFDDCYQHLLATIERRRRGGRRWVEEEEFKPHPAYGHFAYSRRTCQQAREAPPQRAKKSGSRDEEIQYCLQSLADRLEALEIGLEELARVRNSSAPTCKSRIRAKNAPTKKHSFYSRGPFKTTTLTSHINAEQKPQHCESGFRKVKSGFEEISTSSSSLNDDTDVERNPHQNICDTSEKSEMSPEAAALIIQSRFRTYLVRRSQTLRHLRDLAMVKSELKQLNFLFANAGYRRVVRRDEDERKRFCEKGVGLLLKLDSIEGTDSMIRETRRSLSKKVVALLDYVDDDSIDVVEDANKKTSRHPRGHWQSKRSSPAIMDKPVRMCNDSCESCTGQQQPTNHCPPNDFITDANSDDDDEEDEETIIEGLGDWRSQVTGRGPSSFSATWYPMNKKKWMPNKFNMPTSAYSNTSSCSGPRRKFGLPHYIRRDLDDR